jgi:hypothetical protein
VVDVARKPTNEAGVKMSVVERSVIDPTKQHQQRRDANQPALPHPGLAAWYNSSSDETLQVFTSRLLTQNPHALGSQQPRLAILPTRYLRFMLLPSLLSLLLTLLGSGPPRFSPLTGGTPLEQVTGPPRRVPPATSGSMRLTPEIQLWRRAPGQRPCTHVVVVSG